MITCYSVLTTLCVLGTVNMTEASYDPVLYPVVETNEGAVRGLTRSSFTGHTFYSFKGIPYALPPIGPLRFQPPQRHTHWSGVREAFEHGSKSLQFDFFVHGPAEGNEDCLFLNVYTPKLPEHTNRMEPLPVMFYIHGGGFETGSGNEEGLGPHYFMEKQVILVTINYRLGTLGFFSTGDHHAPGNYGMLDMVMALEWTRDNISKFGGDPGNVTIFGLSAGGSAVSLLILSPLATGLFHRAISQSGGAMTPFAANGRDKGSAKRTAQMLNCSTEIKSEMVRQLLEVPADDLIETDRRMEYRIRFVPRVDKEATKSFLPADPRVLLESGRFNRVPWINGITQEEGTWYLTNCLDTDNIEQSAENLFKDLHQLGRVADLTDEAVTPVFDNPNIDPPGEVAKVRDFYESLLTSPVLRAARVVSDRKFVVPISEEIRLASSHTSVYKYVFDFAGPGLHVPLTTDHGHMPDFGPTHVDDLPYTFVREGKQVPIPPVGSDAYKMIQLMTDLLTNFARTGEPSSEFQNMPQWPKFSEEQQLHMRLNLEPSIGQKFHEEEIKFWQSMPINEPWRHPVKY